MTVLINPGSRIPETVENTYECAQRHAHEWLGRMRADGFGDIEMIDTGECHEGRWVFIFRHLVTGVENQLVQHGVDDRDLDQMTFAPRVYWNGSSSAEPCIDDFKAPGFVMTFRADADGH